MDGSVAIAKDEPSELETASFMREVRERMDQAWTHDKDNREDAASDLRFLAGDQWPDAARREREAANRPVMTINRLPQFIRQTTNDIRQNAPVIKVIPSDGASDKKISEIYTGLIRQIQYQSSGAHVYASGAEHAAACGIGHFRIETQFVDDAVFEQEIRVKRITNPLSPYWDPAAVEPDRSDANWCFVTERLPKAEYNRRHPDAAENSVEVPSDNNETDLFWHTEDTVLIAEYWRKVPSKRTIAQFEDGKTTDITDLKPEQLAFLPPIAGQREVDSNTVESYIVSGTEILSGPHPWAGKHIPIIPIIGSEIPLEKKIVRHGIGAFRP